MGDRPLRRLTGCDQALPKLEKRLSLLLVPPLLKKPFDKGQRYRGSQLEAVLAQKQSLGETRTAAKAEGGFVR